MGKKLFIGNLSFRTTEESLRALFESDGRQVAEVTIVTDRATGQSRGFGFVEMATDEDAKAATEAHNGVKLDGRAIQVAEAREREGGPRRGGGGGGGGDRGPRY